MVKRWEPADHRLSIPQLELGPLQCRRAAIPEAALVAAAAAAFAIAGGPAQAFLDAFQRALEADPAVGRRAPRRSSFSRSAATSPSSGSSVAAPRSASACARATQVTLGGAAATRLLPTAGVGGAALTLWSLRRSGLGTRGATRTLLAFLVILYSVFLGSIAITGTLLTLEGGHSLALTALPASLATVGMLLALTAAWLRPADNGGRISTAAAVLGGAVRDAIGHLLALDARLLGALVWWGFDMAVLYGMLNAFGVAPSLKVVVFAYFIGQVGNTIPIPGAVSGGLVGALLAFGVGAGSGDRVRARVPGDSDLAARTDRPGRAQRAAAHDRRGHREAAAVVFEVVEVVPVTTHIVRPFHGERRTGWLPREAPVQVAA